MGGQEVNLLSSPFLIINFESQSTFYLNPSFMKTRIPAIALVLGLILLIYMVTVEDEPGVLSLLLIVSGTAGLLWNHFTSKLKKSS
jgi:hypothetical protein